MRRLTRALLGLGAAAVPLRAQQVPGRDLLEFPVGTLAEARALAGASAGGLWNPSLAGLLDGRRRLSVTALNTPIEQGVASYYFAASSRVRPGTTASVSLLRALVTDLLRTETDPQSLGAEIPYSTSVLSAGVSQSFGDLTAGAALRFRQGTVDRDRGSATSLDLGVSVPRLGRLPIRVGASTFLFSPWARSRERATYMVAADVPVWARGTREVRAGASLARTEQAGHERYLFASGRWGWLAVRGGLATELFAGNATERLRLGFGLHYARYEVGISREDSGVGLGPSYQFMLSSVFR